MLLGPSPPAALNQCKGWQSLLKNDLGVCKALKIDWEKWNFCVCMQIHTCPGPAPLSPPSRIQAGGFTRSYCIVTFLSDLLPDHLSKKRVKKFFAELVGKQQRGRKKKAFQVIQSFHTFGF